MAVNFGKVNRSAAFNPTAAFPLDARYYFDSLSAAETAVAGAVEVGSSEGTYYFGENVVVVENGKATLYLIQPDKTLTEVGSVPVGDGKSIEVVDGKIAILGYGEATAGQQPRIATDGSIEWYTPDTSTVSGLADTVAGHTTDIANLQENKANKADVYTKEEVDNKLSSVYDYKGTVATYGDLPASPEKGDVYNVEAADDENGIKAGDNVAWNGTAWDVLGGTVNLSGYALKTDLDGKVDKNGTDRLMTEAEGEKLAGIEEGAQVNVIDSVDETQFATENKKLTLLEIAMSKVTGLSDALAGKVDKVDGSRLMTDEEGTKLAGVEANAQVNILENIKLGTEDALPISEKGVTIPVAADKLGVIKSSEGDNMVSVDADGAASVASVNVNTLKQTAGETLIINGGSSAV